MKIQRHVYSLNLTPVVILVSGLCLGLLAFGQSRDMDQATGSPDYDLSWFTIDGGGVMASTRGLYKLSGTTGFGFSTRACHPVARTLVG